jgi:glycosyltransferase involved in cell wall biosynthesis
MNDCGILVSVIIPIFNSEKTLDRCLQSVISQPYRNIEIILINDGSTDQSLSICESYRKYDSRIIIVDKENEGVSASRNMGIQIASGKYLQFADSDDWLALDATEQFLRYALLSQCDMVISDFYRVKNDAASIKGHIKKEGILTLHEFAENMSKSPADFYYGVMWNKFYKKDIIKDNDILLDVSMNWCEDFLFNLQYLLFMQKCFVLKKPLYYYVNMKNSLVKQNVSIKNMVIVKKQIWDSYKEVFEKLGMYDNTYKKLHAAKFMVASAKDGSVNRFAKQKVHS